MDVTNNSLVEETVLTTDDMDALINSIDTGNIDSTLETIQPESNSPNEAIDDFYNEAEDQELSNEEEEDEDLEVVERLNEEPQSEQLVIIPNSDTLLIDETTARFSSADWYEEMQKQNITIAGIGGIGSWLSLLIARMKPNSITMYDPDQVETVNMSGQLYGSNQVGIRKTAAMSANINNFCNYYNIVCKDELFTKANSVDDIAICGFDNMEARKNFFIAWKRKICLLNSKSAARCLFIDGRLASEEFQIFCITGVDSYFMREYEKKWLFDDSEAEETICSYKQTTYCASMIASAMTNLLVNFVTNLCNPLYPRELPFMTSYDAATMTLKAKMSW